MRKTKGKDGRVGFKEARKKAVAALEENRFGFEKREAEEVKNLLSAGKVTPEQVVKLLGCCNGRQHDESPHDAVPEIPVHVFKPEQNGVRWYIKVYFVPEHGDADLATFISVHKS